MTKIELDARKSFLVARDVRRNDVVEVLSSIDIISEDKSQFGRKQYQMQVQHDGREKTWTVNYTTLDRLIQEWGKESAEWVGKSIQLYTEVMEIRGKPTLALFGNPVSEGKKVKKE